MAPTLLVIDLQSGLISGDPVWGPRSTPNLTSNVSRILKLWRSQEWPIMHVHHDDADPENPIRQDNPQAFAPHACAAPVAGEPIFTKSTGTSFAAFEQLKREEVREVCMIGMDGGQCINNNTRHAADLGFEVIVVADACASYAMEDYREGKEKRVITAEETHDVSMMMLSNGYAKVMGTDELLRKFGSQK